MTNDKDSAVLAERVERVTKWLDGGCSTWGTPAQDIREVINALRQPTQSEPEAMRYGFDGFGYKYIDSGGGSDWRTRHPDAEPLYLSQPTQSDAVLDGDALPILYLLGVKHGREDERAKIAAELDARGLGIREKNDDR